MMDAFIFYTFKSSVCLSAGYLVYYVLLRKETFHRFKRFLLLGIIVSSLLIPLLKFHRDPDGVNARLQRLESSLIREAPPSLQAIKPALHTPQHYVNDTYSLLSLVYLSGAGLQLVLIVYGLSGIMRIIRKSRKVFHQGIRLAITPQTVIPCCFGRRIILSERDFHERGSAVIAHELTHVKEFHSLDLLISELFLVITWYNPCSWLIRHEIKQNHEFEADRNVLGQGMDITDYQLLLVRTVAGESRFKLVNQLNHGNLKTRITMMNKTKSVNRSFLKALIFLPLLALMVQVFAQRQSAPGNLSARDRLHGKYLELSAEQLKLLGLDLNSSGLFYKNTRFGDQDKGILCLYFTPDTYSASIVLHPGEKIEGESSPERILAKQPLTDFDFYPVVITGYDGWRTLDMMGAERDPGMKLLPVQVSMATLDPGTRTDTLVIWFKPSASLEQVLAEVAPVRDYLQPCPPDLKKEPLGH